MPSADRLTVQLADTCCGRLAEEGVELDTRTVEVGYPVSVSRRLHPVLGPLLSYRTAPHSASSLPCPCDLHHHDEMAQ